MKYLYVIRIPYLVSKTMGKRSRIDQDITQSFQEEREKIMQQIGSKLEEQLAAKNINANRLAKATQMKPETLYKIRDGLQLPSCETIVKVKQMIPELNLNWWLFDQGEPDLQLSTNLKDEIERLRKEVQKYQKIIQEITGLLKDVN